MSPANVAGQYQAVFQPWAAPLTEALEGPLQFGDGAGGNNLGCAAFAPGSLTGKIVLVDRGGCGFSVKISNIAAGGALAGIIGLVAPGEGGFHVFDTTLGRLDPADFGAPGGFCAEALRMPASVPRETLP